MSVISVVKRNLTLEILKIDEKADYITKLKDEAIQTLLEQKENILSGPCKKLSKLPAKIDSKLDELKTHHDSVMGKYSEKQITVHGDKDVYDVVEDELDELEMELKTIQDRHSDVIEQLESKRAFLVEHLNSIQSMEQEVQELEDELLKAKAGLLDQSSADLQSKVDQLSGQISDMNSLEYLKSKCSHTSKEIERLEEAMCMAATPAERTHIDSRLKVLSMQQLECDKLLSLAAMSPKDRFAKLLEERGLFYTPSGRIRTLSGRILTLQEAMEQGLLEGLNNELSELFGVAVSPSGRIITASGHKISASEAAKQGIFKTTESESTISAASSDSTLSGMSTGDVHYLKQYLGKPLALALAEIAAKQPRDPIHYLGHWLFKYRYNQETDAAQKLELEALLAERDRLAREALRRDAEDEARLTLMDLLGRVEIEAARRQIEEELRRIEEEALAREEEEQMLEMEARDTLGVLDGPSANQP